MTSEPPENEPQEPSAGALIMGGLLIIIGAFLTAPFILVLHTPTGH
ncbi:MAG: hypothetical protein JWN14_3062 [Chthonomonadales bacterium]|nr:hypothetical protein [Chthonomonadales bacterium]